MQKENTHLDVYDLNIIYRALQEHKHSSMNTFTSREFAKSKENKLTQVENTINKVVGNIYLIRQEKDKFERIEEGKCSRGIRTEKLVKIY